MPIATNYASMIHHSTVLFYFPSDLSVVLSIKISFIFVAAVQKVLRHIKQTHHKLPKSMDLKSPNLALPKMISESMKP